MPMFAFLSEMTVKGGEFSERDGQIEDAGDDDANLVPTGFSLQK